jgi:TetR/AcrR family transcriptional regulator, transcriptional repressor for nem operon
MGRKPQASKERILEAAIQLFWERGYAATGMADILENSRVNSGSFYYLFKSKEDLLLAVLDKYLEMLHPVLLEPIWQKTADPLERIFGLLAKYRELIIMTGCTYGCPIGRLALEINPAQTEVHHKIAANFAGWAAAIRACLDQLAERLPPEIDRSRLSHFVLTVMEGGVMQSRSYRSVEPFDMAVSQLRDYFDRLLLPKPIQSGKKMKTGKKK